jgi:hypothetical protein
MPGQDSTETDTEEHDQVWHDRTGHDRTRQDRTGLGKARKRMTWATCFPKPPTTSRERTVSPRGLEKGRRQPRQTEGYPKADHSTLRDTPTCKAGYHSTAKNVNPRWPPPGGRDAGGSAWTAGDKSSPEHPLGRDDHHTTQTNRPWATAPATPNGGVGAATTWTHPRKQQQAFKQGGRIHDTSK